MSALSTVYRVVKVSLPIALLCSLFSPTSAKDNWKELVTLLPESTNAVLAIDVDAMFASKLATENNWQRSQQVKLDHQLSMLPTNAKRFVLATELDLQHMEPEWEFAAIKLDHPISIEEVRDAADGHLDSLAGLKSVRTKRGSYLVPFSNNRVGLIRIAARPWAAQQARYGQTRESPACTPFLANAVTRASEQSQLVLALHLEDAVPAVAIRAAVAGSALIPQNELALASLTETLASLDGLLLTVSIAEKIHAKLELNFRNSPGGITSIDKSLILRLIDNTGCSLPEFADWEQSRAGSSVSLAGELSIGGLRKVLSLLHYDTSDIQSYEYVRPPKASHSANQASIEYAAHVTRLVESLAKGANDRTLNTQILWTDRAAKSIMRLSSDGVNPAILDLGRDIAYQLSDIVSVFNAAANSAAVVSNLTAKPPVQWTTQIVPYDSYSTPYGRFYRYTPFSMAQVNVGENIQNNAQIMADALTKANEQATAKFRVVQTKVKELVNKAESVK